MNTQPGLVSEMRLLRGFFSCWSRFQISLASDTMLLSSWLIRTSQWTLSILWSAVLSSWTASELQATVYQSVSQIPVVAKILLLRWLWQLKKGFRLDETYRYPSFFLLRFYPTPEIFWSDLKAPNSKNPSFGLAIDESFDRGCEDFQDDQPEVAKELEGKLCSPTETIDSCCKIDVSYIMHIHAPCIGRQCDLNWWSC